MSWRRRLCALRAPIRVIARVPFAPFTPPQRARVQEYMQGFYNDFVEKAAEPASQGGARLVLKAEAPEDIEALRKHLHQHAALEHLRHRRGVPQVHAHPRVQRARRPDRGSEWCVQATPDFRRLERPIRTLATPTRCPHG